MGDRNNIKVTYHTGDSLYLYTHWRGSELREIVQRCFDKSGRVEDESYFTRVLFCEMLGDNLQDWRGETGFGIATYAPDQDYGNDMIHIDYSTAERGVPQVDWSYSE
jgi:hypothetical protein